MGAGDVDLFSISTSASCTVWRVNTPSSHRFSLFHSKAIIIFIVDETVSETDIKDCILGQILQLFQRFAVLNTHDFISLNQRKQITQRPVLHFFLFICLFFVEGFRASVCAADGLACQCITHGLWKLGQNEAKDLNVENVHLCLLQCVRLQDWLNNAGCLSWGKEHLYFEIFR